MRHLSRQAVRQELYEQFCRDLAAKYPDWRRDEIRRVARKCVSAACIKFSDFQWSPASRWDWIKGRFFPQWALVKWPVRYRIAGRERP